MLKVLRGVKALRQNSLQKNTIETLITFDRVMVLTSNLVHILLMSKYSAPKTKILGYLRPKKVKSNRVKQYYLVFSVISFAGCMYKFGINDDKSGFVNISSSTSLLFPEVHIIKIDL